MFNFFSWLRPKRNSYLEEHCFYSRAHLKPGSRFYGMIPGLPYCVMDLLLDMPMCKKNVFVLKHGITAHWFSRMGCRVTLGRAPKGGHPAPGIDYLFSPMDYKGDSIDLLILDHADWLDKADVLISHLAADGVVMLVYSAEKWEDPRYGLLNQLSVRLKEQNWRRIRLINPSPKVESLACEIWYRDCNFMNL